MSRVCRPRSPAGRLARTALAASLLVIAILWSAGCKDAPMEEPLPGGPGPAPTEAPAGQAQTTPESPGTAAVSAGEAESLATLSGSKDASIYSYMSVNNSHYAAYGADGLLRVVYSDERGAIHLLTREEDGKWVGETIPGTGRTKNPSIVSNGDSLAVAWVSAGSQSFEVEYATMTPEPGAGSTAWQTTGLGAIPRTSAENSVKYLTYAVSDSAHLFGITEGSPDVYALSFSDAEMSTPPLISGLGDLIKSSDITVAAEGDLAVRVWEENWEGYERGQQAHLVVSVSHDGGLTWPDPGHLLQDEPSLGGDPSVCISNGSVYVAWQQNLGQSSGGIFAAVMPAGASTFEPFQFPGEKSPGRIGDGWLVNTSCAGDTLALSWEYTTGAYSEKSEHGVASAYILDADGSPQLSYGPVTDDSPADSTYDLNSNIVLAPDGKTADLFWTTVSEVGGQFVFTLMHRAETIAP